MEYWSREGQFKEKRLPPGQFSWMYENLDRIETPDRNTVTVRFKDPFVPFLAYAASQWNPMVAKEIYEVRWLVLPEEATAFAAFQSQ